MTAAFLEFSKSRGNDLSTPRPEFKKHWKQAKRLAWSCAPLTKAPSATARSPISNVSPWTSRDADGGCQRIPQGLDDSAAGFIARKPDQA
jgi:hypothetical protein